MNLERPKILCVDDEAGITSALRRVLIKDFDVFEAHSVHAAKQILEAQPDLAILLTDQSLPDGTGSDLLSFARENRPETVRALLTAHVDIGAFLKAVNDAQIHRLILKPWDNDYLRAQMLEALAAHSGLREKRDLEKQAITDTVTLVRNHRFFQDQLKIEVERATRHSRSLSLIMIDIDHFKRFNDTFGHPVGDAVLRQVAQRLSEAVRSLDTVARYGGEEFGILLPDTPAEGALLVAERIREAVGSKPFNVGNSSETSIQDLSPTVITLSLGVATVPTHASTPKDLVRKADAALYRAKRQGRNQSVVASDERPLD